MLDLGLFRTGGEEYEQEHGTHGVTTLHRDHVTVRGDDLHFLFPAKSGVEREARVTDPPLAVAIRALKRSNAPGERLLQYRDSTGWHEVTGAEVNEAFKTLTGADFTVKDLRTWAATVTAAAALAEKALRDDDPSPSKTAVAKSEREVIRLVSEQLGNTPAVARRSYVDPVVLDKHASGTTLVTAGRLFTRLSKVDHVRILVRRDPLAAAVARPSSGPSCGCSRRTDRPPQPVDVGRCGLSASVQHQPDRGAGEVGGRLVHVVSAGWSSLPSGHPVSAAQHAYGLDVAVDHHQVGPAAGRERADVAPAHDGSGGGGRGGDRVGQGDPDLGDAPAHDLEEGGHPAGDRPPVGQARGAAVDDDVAAAEGVAPLRHPRRGHRVGDEGQTSRTDGLEEHPHRLRREVDPVADHLEDRLAAARGPERRRDRAG